MIFAPLPLFSIFGIGFIGHDLFLISASAEPATLFSLPRAYSMNLEFSPASVVAEFELSFLVDIGSSSQGRSQSSGFNYSEYGPI